MRERRLAQGLTQREVVGRLETRGVRTTNRALSTMENGRGLDLGLLPELAEALDCTITYLLGLADDPHAWRPDRAVRMSDGPAGAAMLLVPTSGVLGDLPDDFAAPGRSRRRANGHP